VIGARSEARGAEGTEAGTALILAIVFLMAMGILVVVLGNLATEASTTTINAHNQTTLETNAESAATAAIQQVRRGYLYPVTLGGTIYGTPSNPGLAQACEPPGALNGAPSSLTVFCKGYQFGATRTVDFYVCGPSTVAAAQCTAPMSTNEVLFASVTFVDVPSGDSPLSASCGPTSGATCGVTMVINQWDVRTADN
jgi:hypothetical protein